LRNTRPISWIKGARKDFEAFPAGAQMEMARALTILAEGRMPDIAKPLIGFGAGVMELALKHRGDAFRVVYALRIGDDIWVIHAFQKKSKSGIKTPRMEVDLIKDRLKRLKEALQGALASLAPKYQDVFILRDVEKVNIADTARILGISIASVKTRLLRARLLMRDALAPGFDGNWTSDEGKWKKVRPW